MKLINKDIKKRKYTLNPIETYNIVMNLKKERGWGAKRIKKYLDENKISSSMGAIRGWMYYNKKPFIEKIVTQISKNSKELTKEKAYILGTLCGDGYISTGYRIGLEVCNKEFAEYFKSCLEKAYGIKCSIGERTIKSTNFCKNPKIRYSVMLVSKLTVRDLKRFSKSFKSKEWKVPKQIINGSKEIQATFIRGLSDSEASVRFRKGQSEVYICSGNISSLLIVKEILKNRFNIDTHLEKLDWGVAKIVITKYICLKRFYDEIGFIIKRKQENLKRALDSYKRKGINRYSKEFKLKAIQLLKRGLKHREIAKLLGTSHTNIYDWEKLFFKKCT